MKRKSYIMPVVLLIFSLVLVVFFSIYYRTIFTHNHKISKENLISKKINEISLEEILNTKATLNFVNSKLNNRENFNVKINFKDLLNVNNITNFQNNFDTYEITLASKRIKKNLNFYDKSNKSKKYNVSQYEIFFEVKNYNELIEYKFVDKNRIENYIFDEQVKNYIDENTKLLNNDFYFDLNKDYSKLYNRIFTQEIQNTYTDDLRIYDYKDKIYFVYNEQYKKLLRSYLDLKQVTVDNLDINLCDIDDFKNCSRDDFINLFLVESSDFIKDYKYSIINIDVKNKLYLDFNKNVDIYSNVKINSTSEIIVTNKIPKVQGVIVNNSENKKFDFYIEGVLFSKYKIKSDYKFLPEILDVTARFIKISDDYYVEKMEKNDIK
ncbi:hypothetical protein VJI77_00305 [Parvimonas sp. D2]|uniref:hypothetical protein n=1 Tax=unclassified Parvimonas TaxID=1151464 RepID=UPI002B48195F|nr:MULTISPECIES: hypothetical protein [unclassified Parvimonas]MEB3011444.1 hypothetical protein [Parvimonas sp. D2]MEB3086936.1 hypothetical protein [Parvimonas sp. D4]